MPTRDHRGQGKPGSRDRPRGRVDDGSIEILHFPMRTSPSSRTRSSRAVVAYARNPELPNGPAAPGDACMSCGAGRASRSPRRAGRHRAGLRRPAEDTRPRDYPRALRRRRHRLWGAGGDGHGTAASTGTSPGRGPCPPRWSTTTGRSPGTARQSRNPPGSAWRASLTPSARGAAARLSVLQERSGARGGSTPRKRQVRCIPPTGS